MWDALHEICLREDVPLARVISFAVDAQRKGPLTSAIRMFVISYFRQAATEAGHIAAGHKATEPPLLP